MFSSGGSCPSVRGTNRKGYKTVYSPLAVTYVYCGRGRISRVRWGTGGRKVRWGTGGRKGITPCYFPPVSRGGRKSPVGSAEDGRTTRAGYNIPARWLPALPRASPSSVWCRGWSWCASGAEGKFLQRSKEIYRKRAIFAPAILGPLFFHVALLMLGQQVAGAPVFVGNVPQRVKKTVEIWHFLKTFE